MSDDAHGISTRCIHAGERLDDQGGIHPPPYNHSTFGFLSTKEVLDVVKGRTKRSLYTRYGLNPTIVSVEEKIANLGRPSARSRLRASRTRHPRSPGFRPPGPDWRRSSALVPRSQAARAKMTTTTHGPTGGGS